MKFLRTDIRGKLYLRFTDQVLAMESKCLYFENCVDTPLFSFYY